MRFWDHVYALSTYIHPNLESYVRIPFACFDTDIFQDRIVGRAMVNRYDRSKFYTSPRLDYLYHILEVSSPFTVLPSKVYTCVKNNPSPLASFGTRSRVFAARLVYYQPCFISYRFALLIAWPFTVIQCTHSSDEYSIFTISYTGSASILLNYHLS